MSRVVVFGECDVCGKKHMHLMKLVCYNCYKRVVWKRKIKECPRCKRQKPIHARGFCRGCYMSLFHIEKVKQENIKKMYGIDYETYKQITKCCVVCGFDKKVSLHHIDKDRTHNSQDNFVGLCPNHHTMIHDRKYQDEVIAILREKGYTLQPLIKIMPINQPEEPPPTQITKIALLQITINKTEEPEQSQVRKEDANVVSVFP